MRKIILIILILMVTQGFAQEQEKKEMKFSDVLKLDFQYEKGFLKLFHHKIQIGDNGTNFDYLKQGGQEILFPFDRFSIDARLFKHHKISFLYQPLTLNTKTRFYSDVTIDDVTFPANSIVEMKYGFPFYRLTYAFQFFIKDVLEIGAGLALQLRNASITFNAEGGLSTSSQNLGPVPALHINVRWPFSIFYLYYEITGLYTSLAFLNGSDFSFEGSILDTSLRFGINLHKHVGAYANIRFLGGTAKGTSGYSNTRWSESRERYTSNSLATGSLSFGVEAKF